MIIPIRCMSCGRPVAHLWEKYNKRIKKESPGKVLDDLGLERYCCRSLFLTHKDTIEEIAKFRI